ncbi:ribosomal protein L7Ae, putative [Trichomonas vaginalis G3]|uniref:Ribosomal protein L7Ae, putative n=1 Tax=Trichomonas vaginalis (strain ATCC PRA-98 / G3) TaxID=412133 RepID=A2E9B5_TRIV3|nr:50S ribosomal protein L30e-like family [Trichomonas vaginalis G3]EAY10800.1 ribosomal protein L7Ae, putative [Trichomonas vaginalis G3]KAI5536060.1 50S ribosomal protein L30e-like family [Trichomonas vaginalis G3]|eukprot:XP_001323023.1 ribosomal protein L7Ae [Trichomonas vaginalis G3]
MEKAPKILNLDQKITYPSPNQEGTTAIASMLKKLIREKQVEIRINSTNKSIIGKKAKIVVVASCINPPSLVDHILFMCSKKNIPIICCSLDPRGLGKEVGMKSLTVSAIKDSADKSIINLLMPFTQFIPESSFPQTFT